MAAKFLSTPSARRATHPARRLHPRRNISIHALREEGDQWLRVCRRRRDHFYPRPPRGGRRSSTSDRAAERNFYPRPPRGGRPGRLKTNPQAVKISIHALREEGDLNHSCHIMAYALFLSTPSARRATGRLKTNPQAVKISIHALREEGDKLRSATLSSLSLFLSTPSARRATAKTETKSLFSNKLYNILHEFRRALIYNGSKNYPNHAK